MVRVNGHTFLTFRKVPFNAVIDVKLSDQIPVSDGGSGAPHLLEDEVTGEEFQYDELIGATVYLVFIDGIKFRKVTGTLDVTKKQYTHDSDTGTITLSIPQSEPVDLSVFYTSSGTTGTPPTEPVTVAEFKACAKIDTDLDDDLIQEYITTARQQCEDYSGISIVNRTVTAVLNNSCGGIYLPYGPVIDITSVTDQDDEDALDEDDYTVNGIDFLQLIDPVSDKVTLVYTAGYGIPPDKIKSAIKQQTFYLYHNRGEVDVDLSLSPQAKATLNRIRRVS